MDMLYTYTSKIERAITLNEGGGLRNSHRYVLSLLGIPFPISSEM